MSKISDVVAELQKVQQEKGDLEVVVLVDRDGDGTYYDYEGTITAYREVNMGDGDAEYFCALAVVKE